MLGSSRSFNAQTEEYEDLLAAGVLDPTKVVRSSLQNAASVAALLLPTQALVAEKPEEKKGGGMPDMGGMGGMGDIMWLPSGGREPPQFAGRRGTPRPRRGDGCSDDSARDG